MAPFHNYPVGPGDRQSLGRGADATHHQRRSPYLLLAARERPARSGRRQPQGHRPYVDLRADGLRQDGPHRLSGRHARPPGRHAGGFRQGSGARNSGAGLGRRVFAAEERRADGLQSAAAASDPRQRRISQGMAARIERQSAARGFRPLTVREEADLDQALRGTLALDAPARRCRAWSSFWIQPIRKGCMRGWLAGARHCAATTPGCSTTRPIRSLRASQADRVIGFDVTEFLDHPLTRSPVTLYLFHLVRQLLDGRRLVCWMDEFWRLLADPAFESFRQGRTEDLAKAERRHVPRDPKRERRARSPISRTLVEQTPTKIFFPNADATGVHRGLRAHRAGVQAHQGSSSSRARACSWSSRGTTASCASWISKASMRSSL